ncbi:MAG: hypothetical protein EPN14_09050 [Gallionella sp.]|nr:MAG: hypothetical protein EPN14_09050 [Gallionella sp.]
MNKHAMGTALAVLLASASCAAYANDLTHSSAAKLAQQPATPERAENSVNEMEKLFSGSSAAKQVGNSKSGAVSTLMHDAENIRHEAHEALESKNYAEAIHLSNEAKKAFFAAAQQAEPGVALASKEEGDFKHMLDSVNALTGALERTAKESGKNSDAALKNIHGLVKNANNLAAEKKHVDGRKLLDKAFLALKVAIESIKQGTTVTAQKDNSPKGIYEYEAFRNDTYLSLVEMFMDERKKMAIASDTDFLNDVRLASEIRKEGLASGEKKRYEEASKRLGDSTSIYKRAVRRAGVPIFD